jgi:hypothetical protein
MRECIRSDIHRYYTELLVNSFYIVVWRGWCVVNTGCLLLKITIKFASGVILSPILQSISPGSSLNYAKSITAASLIPDAIYPSGLRWKASITPFQSDLPIFPFLASRECQEREGHPIMPMDLFVNIGVHIEFQIKFGADYCQNDKIREDFWW